MPAADQIQAREGDKRQGTNESAHRILAEQSDTTSSGVFGNASRTADTAAMVQSQALPDLRVDGDDSQPAQRENGFMHFVHSTEAVVSDLARGAVDEVVHHPGQVVGSAITGLAVGAAALVLAPEIAAGAAIAGGLYGAFQIGTHIGGWAHSADVVSNAEDHTKKEVNAAHQDLEGVGGGGVRIAAGVVGSFGAAPIIGAATDAIAGAAVSAESGAIDSVTANGGQALLEGPKPVLRLTGPLPRLTGPAAAEATTAAAETTVATDAVEPTL